MNDALICVYETVVEFMFETISFLQKSPASKKNAHHMSCTLALPSLSLLDQILPQSKKVHGVADVPVAKDEEDGMPLGDLLDDGGSGVFHARSSFWGFLTRLHAVFGQNETSVGWDFRRSVSCCRIDLGKLPGSMSCCNGEFQPREKPSVVKRRVLFADISPAFCRWVGLSSTFLHINHRSNISAMNNSLFVSDQKTGFPPVM